MLHLRGFSISSSSTCKRISYVVWFYYKGRTYCIYVDVNICMGSEQLDIESVPSKIIWCEWGFFHCVLMQTLWDRTGRGSHIWGLNFFRDLGCYTSVCFPKYLHLIVGFEILAFPCNQFGGQEPGSNSEIKNFACTRFKADFPIFDKVNKLHCLHFMLPTRMFTNWSFLGFNLYRLMLMDLIPHQFIDFSNPVLEDFWVIL